MKDKLIFRKIKAMHLINCYNMNLAPFKNTFCVPNGVDTPHFQNSPA